MINLQSKAVSPLPAGVVFPKPRSFPLHFQDFFFSFLLYLYTSISIIFSPYRFKSTYVFLKQIDLNRNLLVNKQLETLSTNQKVGTGKKHHSDKMLSNSKGLPAKGSEPEASSVFVKMYFNKG